MGRRLTTKVPNVGSENVVSLLCDEEAIIVEVLVSLVFWYSNAYRIELEVVSVKSSHFIVKTWVTLSPLDGLTEHVPPAGLSLPSTLNVVDPDELDVLALQVIRETALEESISAFRTMVELLMNKLLVSVLSMAWDIATSLKLTNP